MAADLEPIPAATASELVSGIISDAQRLIQQQFSMIRQEIREDLRKSKDGLIALVMGVGITIVGSVLLLLMVPLLLNWSVPTLPLWACCGIVGGSMTALGGALVYVAIKKFGSFNPLSDQSVEGMKENLTWTTKP